MRKILLSLTLISLASTGASGAIQVDLNNGSFVTLPVMGLQPYAYTGVFHSGFFLFDQTIDPNASFVFDFEFVSSSGFAQYIQLADGPPNALPNEGVIFLIEGTGTSSINPVIRFSGATGSFQGIADPPVIVNNQLIDVYLGTGEPFGGVSRIGEYGSFFPNDPALAASSTRDVTNDVLRFFDVHLEIFNAGPNPITVTDLSFLAIGSTVTIGTVPEPVSLVVWSLLAATVVAVGWRRRASRA